jgi:dihydrofolate reductase
MAGKVSLYIACSLDGYIAGPDDNLDFLKMVEADGQDYGYHAFIQTVDAVIAGRKTYDWVVNQVAYPHADKECYIISHRPGPERPGLHFYNGDIKKLVENLKQRGLHVYCEGGAQILWELMRWDLVDALIISYIPTILGAGTLLFKPGMPETRLKLISADSYASGLVQLAYERISLNNY